MPNSAPFANSAKQTRQYVLISSLFTGLMSGAMQINAEDMGTPYRYEVSAHYEQAKLRSDETGSFGVYARNYSLTAFWKAEDHVLNAPLAQQAFVSKPTQATIALYKAAASVGDREYWSMDAESVIRDSFIVGGGYTNQRENLNDGIIDSEGYSIKLGYYIQPTLRLELDFEELDSEIPNEDKESSQSASVSYLREIGDWQGYGKLTAGNSERGASGGDHFELSLSAYPNNRLGWNTIYAVEELGGAENERFELGFDYFVTSATKIDFALSRQTQSLRKTGSSNPDGIALGFGLLMRF